MPRPAYSDAAMLRARIDRTRDKIRAGTLPPTADERPVIEKGDGNLCSGCGEAIAALEDLYRVRAMPVRFHDVCYYVWTTFKLSP